LLSASDPWVFSPQSGEKTTKADELHAPAGVFFYLVLSHGRFSIISANKQSGFIKSKMGGKIFTKTKGVKSGLKMHAMQREMLAPSVSQS
jgi:hypothetical protein